MKFIFLLFIALLSGCDDTVLSNNNSFFYSDLKYDTAKDLSSIGNNTINNLVTFSFSQNKKNLILSKIKNYDEPEIYISKYDNLEQITNNNSIEIDPLINNNGDYAYLSFYNSTSEGEIFFNSQKLDLEKGLYKLLALNNNSLFFSLERLYDNKHLLYRYNINSQKLDYIEIEGVVVKAIHLDDDETILQVYNENRQINELFLLNSVLDITDFKKNNEFLLDDDENNIKIYSFTNITKNEKYLFNSYYTLLHNNLQNSYSNGNNYLGRLTWYVTYRLEALIKLYKKTNDQRIKNIIINSINKIVFNMNKKMLSWCTKKYSLDKNSNLSLIVDDSRIFYSLMLFVNSSIESSELKQRILKYSKKFYTEKLKQFDNKHSLFRIVYGIKFQLDGVYTPSNWQNIFGLFTIELYKSTHKEEYIDFLILIGKKFKNQFQYSDENILWHYWPTEYYNGWDLESNISINTPTKLKEIDVLYEDTSHAGENLKFIINFNSEVLSSIFTNDDIVLIKNTLQNNIVQKRYSRFISGDTTYDLPKFRFFPYYGWSELENLDLQNLYLNILPNIYPNFESEYLLAYINQLRNITSFDCLSVRTQVFSKKGLTLNDEFTKNYCGLDIINFFDGEVE